MRWIAALIPLLGASVLLLAPDPAARLIQLPAGVLELREPFDIPPWSHDLEVRGAPGGTIIRAAAGFVGRSLITCRSASRVVFSGFTIDGNRDALEIEHGLPPHDVAFSEFSRGSGLLAEDTTGLRVTDVEFRNIAGFSILISRSSEVIIDGVRIQNSGSLNHKGRNNSTGGVLLEEGTRQFRVVNSDFRNVRGNGVWTHSRYRSPRNGDGLIAWNTFRHIGRDAVQIGHATRVRVVGNGGCEIGYPVEEVDMENGAIPAALDTAGNTDLTTYEGNRFFEVNGKCMDLDGFHDGEIRGNTCINGGPADSYPFGNYGIVMNNSNPHMQSKSIVIRDNELRGFKFGGIFVIGSEHRIIRNRLLNLNTARCNDTWARFGCLFRPNEPDLLRTGIYLGTGAERPAPARDNLIAENDVSGFGMRKHCIVTAPGILVSENIVRGNSCRDVLATDLPGHK